MRLAALAHSFIGVIRPYFGYMVTRAETIIAVSLLFDSFCSVRSSIGFPYFWFCPFSVLATLVLFLTALVYNCF